MSIKGLVSVVIPARNEKYLQKTILDLLEKCEEDIEVIANLDGYWPPKEEIVEDDRVHYIHKGEAEGMRQGINDAVAMAKGEYIMKLDGHCMMAQGWDKALKADLEPNWVSIPTRKRLDADKWELQDVGKPDINYNYLSYLDNPADWGGKGLNGRPWNEKNADKNLENEKIVDEMSFQGSCWFMKRDYFYELELMDYENYGSFWNEAQEIGLKCWLSGGRVIRNKNTWYAHLRKGKNYETVDADGNKRRGRGYFLNEKTLQQGRNHTIKWLDHKMYSKQIYDMHWFIARFWPVPNWPEEYSPENLKLEKQIIHSLKETKVGEKIEYIEYTEKWIEPVSYLDYKRKLVNFVDIKTRDQLAMAFKDLGFKKGVEIGTEAGKYAEVLLKENPELELFCIDPWETYGNYRNHVSETKWIQLREDAVKRTHKYKNCRLIKGYSHMWVDAFEDNSLDFVYIDGNHDFLNTARDIAMWHNKVKVGGIVAGHDYNRLQKKDYKCHVQDVVDAWVSAMDIEALYITEDDSAKSWFYVKR